MVKFSVGPVQPTPLFVNVGVTVTVAVIGDVPLLTAAKAGIFPVPFAASPMAGFVLVHEYVVAPPVLFVLKLTAVIFVPLHTVWSAGSLTCATGLTVNVNVSAVPVQLTPLFVKVGVTVIVAVTGDVPALTAANAVIFPLPDAGSPMPGVLFTQE